jgi:hypothetical protein
MMGATYYKGLPVLRKLKASKKKVQFLAGSSPGHINPKPEPARAWILGKACRPDP